MTAPQLVIVRATGRTGRLTLNRPKVLNALNLNMIRSLQEALDSWIDDDRIETVVLDGAGQRGFCAGGDVVALREHILKGELEQVDAFFREEYALNALIDQYPKPIVVIADGVTMGGGIGLAGHAEVRLVTERSKLAMPETKIGFVPDVGGALLLARAPGRIGEYLALTGATVSGTDSVAIGLADRLVSSSSIASLIEALETGTGVESAISSAPRPETSDQTLIDDQPWIDDAFSGDTVIEIVDRLRADKSQAGQHAAAEIESTSPIAATVTLESVRRARDTDDLRLVLEQDHRLAMWFATTQTDMPEGIRTQLIDRGEHPRWNPISLNQVEHDSISAAFGYQPQAPVPNMPPVRTGQ